MALPLPVIPLLNPKTTHPITMLNTLKDWLESLVSPEPHATPQARAHQLQLATAVLLVEVLRADASRNGAEQGAAIAAMQNHFTLTDEELTHLMELAEQTAKTSYDYQRFTGSLNDHCTQAQKFAVVEAMWRVAYADAHLDAHENHVISKVSGLLHLTHGEYIAAKLRAKADSSAP